MPPATTDSQNASSRSDLLFLTVLVWMAVLTIVLFYLFTEQPPPVIASDLA